MIRGMNYRLSIQSRILVFIVAILLVSCSESVDKIKNKINSELVVKSKKTNHKFYVSNIYDDEELGEVFWEKAEDEIVQISNEKQNISSLLLDESRNVLMYCQSQKSDRPSKVEKVVTINSPSGFHDYRIFTYDLNTNTKKELLNLSNHEIVGGINSLCFLEKGKILAFEAFYGRIYLMKMDNSNMIEKFELSSNQLEQLKFSEFYNLKTDGDDCLFFDAVSGYKSKTEREFVYNTFMYNIKTKEVVKVTENQYVQ